MTKARRYKNKPQRTISTRSFNPNFDLLNKLTNSSEIPDSTESLQSNMAGNSSSANDYHNIDNQKENQYFGKYDISCC